MKHESSKQGIINEQYQQLKKEHFTNQMLCTGCCSSMNSQPSHLIPRNRRQDLIADIRNIKPHCPSCHIKWENPLERKSLLDYEENIEIVKLLDYEYYKMIIRHE